MKSSLEEIAEYLRAHPEFFEAYASMLADIQVPTPHGAQDDFLKRASNPGIRDKNQILQDKLEELILFGKENDAIAEKMHHLAVSLLTFRRLPDLLDGLLLRCVKTSRSLTARFVSGILVLTDPCNRNFYPSAARFMRWRKICCTLIAGPMFQMRSEAGSANRPSICVHLR